MSNSPGGALGGFIVLGGPLQELPSELVYVTTLQAEPRGGDFDFIYRNVAAGFMAMLRF